MYKFPGMMPPAEKFPVGSYEWSNSMAARLQEASLNVDRHTATQLRQIILEISDTEAWNKWPKPPAGTPEDFCQIVCDRSWDGLIDDVLHHTRDEKIARSLEYELRLANAKAQNANRKPGRPPKGTPYGIRKLSDRGHDGGTSASYTLRRLLRERPALVARVESGELSVNAAAIEAGFRKRLTSLEQIHKLWAKLDKDDRNQHLDWTLNQCATCGRLGTWKGSQPQGSWCDACCEEGMSAMEKGP